jgi:WD40 repeat protein
MWTMLRHLSVLLGLMIALVIGGPSHGAVLSFVPSVDRLPHRLLSSSPVAATTAIPTQPLLRLDTGMPSGAFAGLAVDPAGHWLVIAGEDETARVWAIDTGQLISVLRPPIGEGHIGELSAAAISVDGETVALSWRSEDSASIFLFERTTGALKGRIDGLIDVATGLKFSPHGVQLAASLVSGGLQLFDVASAKEVAHDINYQGESYSVDFSPDGRYIVTTCTDGFLRLYGIDHRRMQRLVVAKVTNLTAKPITARFGPDGKQISLAYDSVDSIQIRTIHNLTQSTLLMTPFISSNFSDTSWAKNGEYLYSSYVSTKGDSIIRRWKRTTADYVTGSLINILSHHEDIAVNGRGMITSVLALPTGGAVFATSGPAWGVVSESGAVEWRQGAVNTRYANYAVDPSRPLKLLLSADGRRVGFNYDGKQSPAVFDLTRRTIGSDESGLSPPRTSAPGLSISISGRLGLFALSTVTLVNGQRLKLGPTDYSTSFAIAPDGQSFVVGSAFAVSLFSRDGALIWRRPGRAFAVNISGDGQWVVADFRDGTLRWYRARDGNERLSLFPHPDRQRWVMWTPGGYYDASPGGEDLIGWNVNRGMSQAADFFPVSRFADAMHRPDVLDRVLQVDNESDAVRLANAVSGRVDSAITPDAVAVVLPPVLDLVSAPALFAEEPVTIHYRVRTPPDAPMIGEPRVKVNGEWQPTSRAAHEVAADGARTLVLASLPRRDAAVEVYAENRNGVSTPLSVLLRWDGRATVSPGRQGSAAKQKPRLFLLAVGISQYQRPDLKLNFADRDAQQFTAAMQAQKGKQYAQVSTRLLVNGDATLRNVLDGLAWLESQVSGDDVGILFLAGHGFQTPDQNYFYAPADFDPSRPRQTGVDYKAIRKALARFSQSGNKAVFLIDTCYAGGALGPNLGASSGADFAASLSEPRYGVVVLTASKGDQLSFEDSRWRDGAFTKALLDGIVNEEAGSPQSPDITVLELGSYVTKRVRALTDQRQTPLLMTGGVEDFPVATR